MKARSFNKEKNDYIYFYNGLYFKDLWEMENYIDSGSKYKSGCVSDNDFDWKKVEVSAGQYDGYGDEIYLPFKKAYDIKSEEFMETVKFALRAARDEGYNQGYDNCKTNIQKNLESMLRDNLKDVYRNL